MEPICSNWVNKLFEINLDEQINMDSNPFYYQIKTWMPDCSIKIEMDDFRSFFARVKKYKGSANVYEIFCRALLKNDHERELDQFLKCPDTDKELKLTIVKELAKKGSSRISTFGNVNEYEVTSEKDRIEIIKSLITSSFFLERVLERFKEYQITDQEALIELANYAAKKNVIQLYFI